MIKRWLIWLSCFSLGTALLLGVAGGVYWFKQADEISCNAICSKECCLPKGAFELPEHAYEQAGEIVLTLQQAPPSLQIPDLKNQIVYYGKNGRPDAQSQYTLLHFAISANSKETASIPPDEKLYLTYDRSGGKGRYSFSPNNEATSLWIEATPANREVDIRVSMQNDKGEFISEPEAYAQFKLPEKEFVRYGGTLWEIGGFRVDGTLLARQKARWCGGDRFLEEHGGSEFKNIQGKQRIDFGEKENLYSVFVETGDCLVWENSQWRSALPGEETLKFPILHVKKAEEKLMSFDLWNVEGKGKVTLNLLKTSDPWAAQNANTLKHMFKFLGARTRTQCVFEINRERVILRPSDWLLLTPKGWKKLTTEEEIDDYVQRKVTGTLFVFEEIKRKDEKQVMIGTIYSPARHECQPVELPLQVKGSQSSKDGKEKIKEAIEAARAASAARAQNMTQRLAEQSPTSK